MNSGEETVAHFKIVDYSVFVLLLAVSAFIGFYYALKDKNNKTIEHVLLGGRKLKVKLSLKNNIYLYIIYLIKNQKDISSSNVHNGFIYICCFSLRIFPRNV
jgi:hypothetical protein